jgi:hypothetical protein
MFHEQAQTVSPGFHRLGVVVGAAASVLLALAMLGNSGVNPINNGGVVLGLVLISALLGVAIYGLVMVVSWVISGFAPS